MEIKKREVSDGFSYSGDYINNIIIRSAKCGVLHIPFFVDKLTIILF